MNELNNNEKTTLEKVVNEIYEKWQKDKTPFSDNEIKIILEAYKKSDMGREVDAKTELRHYISLIHCILGFKLKTDSQRKRMGDFMYDISGKIYDENIDIFKSLTEEEIKIPSQIYIDEDNDITVADIVYEELNSLYTTINNFKIEDPFNKLNRHKIYKSSEELNNFIDNYIKENEEHIDKNKKNFNRVVKFLKTLNYQEFAHGWYDNRGNIIKPFFNEKLNAEEYVKSRIEMFIKDSGKRQCKLLEDIISKPCVKEIVDNHPNGLEYFETYYGNKKLNDEDIRSITRMVNYMAGFQKLPSSRMIES